MKIKSKKDENVNSTILKYCWEYSKFHSNGFGWIINKWIKIYELEDKEIAQFNPINVSPSWIFPAVNVDIKLLKMKNDWNLKEIGVKTDIYLRNSYYNYAKIYSDGSKNSKGCVGIGIYISEFKIDISKRLSDQLSVFTAEMVAVIISLQWVEEVRPDRVVICTDSKAVIESIQGEGNNRKDLVLEIQHSLFRLYRGGIDVWFCWVPAHQGVKGNERADKLAKRALDQAITIKIPIGKGEGKSIIKNKEMEIWQKRWNEDKKGRKLYKIQKSIFSRNVKERNRREEIIMTRLRVGHTYLNDTLYLIGKKNNDKCEKCGEKENVEHILLNCKTYEREREKLRRIVGKTDQEWSLKGILGNDGNIMDICMIRKALFIFLQNTKLKNRI
ncbi:uncharacterized protein LOC122846005 [Gambusia affinis]|nr:uncharacterized protein LOC122846005 [Gambusia affinis]